MERLVTNYDKVSLSLAFSPGRENFLSGGQDGTINTWKVGADQQRTHLHNLTRRILNASSIPPLTIPRLDYSPLFLTGDRNIARAQLRADILAPSATTKPANPPVPKYASPSAGNRSTNASLDGKRKYLEFKKAIADGNNARNKSDYVTAFSAYLKASKLLQTMPVHITDWDVYFDLYCYHSAIDFYSQAARLKPNYFDALMQLGYAYSNKEQYDNAEAQFEAALRVNPKSIAAKLARVYVWAKKGKSQEAIDGINKVINERSTADKDRASAYIVLGDVYVAQRNGRNRLNRFRRRRS